MTPAIDDRAAIDLLVRERRDLWLRRHRLELELAAVETTLVGVEVDLARRVSELTVVETERHSPAAAKSGVGV